jgi:nicotinamidase-related amidase
MMAMDSQRCALLLVDLQERLMPMIDQGEQVLKEAVFLGEVAKTLGLPRIGTEQNPAGLGPNAASIRDLCEVTISKMHFDACKDGLLDLLSATYAAEPKLASTLPATRQIVVAGCEAHVCLLQTSLGLLAAGYQVFVVAPACGSRNPENHHLAMNRLEKAGGNIVSSEMVAFEWLNSCKNPAFKSALQLIKNHG